MLSRFFNRWSQSRAFTPHELGVLRLLLPVGTEYSERLFSQAAKAPHVERKLTAKNEYEAVIPYVVDDSMLIECNENIESPTISATTTTGVTVIFSATILRGGFLRGLKGHTTDGSDWPKEWAIDLQNAKIPTNLRTWIPMPIGEEARNRAIGQLCSWCGIGNQESFSPPEYEIVRVAEPASDAVIRACEARLNVRLSEQYCQLVSLTNGFGIQRGRPYEFLGTFDIDYVNGAREWLCLTPLYEDGCIALRCNNGIALDECYLLSGVGAPIHIGDIKRHARESLLWEDAAM